jgi:Tfp pilus assembly protein PilN
MAMAARSTRFLTESRVELVPASRATLRIALGVAVLAILAALAWMQYGGPGSAQARVGQLETENAALRTELSELRMELDIERATRAALDQQVADLNGLVGELASQVDFYRAKGAPRVARRPD